MFVSPAHIDWNTKKTIFEAIQYEPFGAQPHFHASTALIRVFAAGNQSGKTHAAAREIIPQLLLPIYDARTKSARARRGWIVVPRYALADPILHEIHEILQGKLGWRRVRRVDSINEGEYHYSVGRHELTTWLGAKLWVKSSDEPASLHAQPLDYIVIDEAALVPYDVVQVNLLPRLTVTGGWLAAVGTFEHTAVGQWYVDFWRIGQTENDQGIESFRHPTTLNPYVDKAWLEAQRAIYDEDLFAARFLAIPKPDDRLVFRKFSYVNNVDAKRCTFNPDLPVYLGIDPGGVYAVVAWQPVYVEGVGDVICVIDEVYDRGGGPSEKIIQEVKSRDWFSNVGTMDRVVGAIDISAKESWQIWMRHGIVGLQRNRVQILTGIDELSNYITQGRLLVHPRCKNLLNEFAEYKYPRVAEGHEARARLPVDEHNHALKALIYSVVARYGYRFLRPARARGVRARLRGIL